MAENTLQDNDCSIRVYQSFVKNLIMLNAFSDPSCSKLCWHNRLVPIFNSFLLLYSIGLVIYASIQNCLATSYITMAVCLFSAFDIPSNDILCSE